MSAPLDVLSRTASFMANEGHGKTDFVCALRNDFTEARAAVAELVEAGRKLRMHRAGVADANAMFVAPVIAKADAEAFAAALAKFGGAA